ncbi:hypothetical protein [Nocardia arthritidis]|uniref:Uncharacterized protein n=1 Tax=Nocardia arthritidis TaxID=228602 RepID=A0A6G9Y9J0_9NOCA|nr:hypothetical protein [Nocardia arthritidis]QIS09716.1 hypothetical protein F5544_09075 [Nocardia arthritidis]
MTLNRKPGDYTLKSDGVSPDYLRVLPDGRQEQAQCEAGLVAYQVGPGVVICGRPGLEFPVSISFPLVEVRPDEPGGGDSTGVREPRRPVPPSPNLRGVQNIPPDSDPISLRGTDH